MDSLRILTKNISDVTAVLTLLGPLDSFTSSCFNRAVMDCVDEGRTQMIVDLSGMEMLTSAGIGELAGAFNDLDEQGGELCLVGLPEQAARALEQLALLDMFRVFPDVETAKAQFSS